MSEPAEEVLLQLTWPICWMTPCPWRRCKRPLESDWFMVKTQLFDAFFMRGIPHSWDIQVQDFINGLVFTGHFTGKSPIFHGNICVFCLWILTLTNPLKFRVEELCRFVDLSPKQISSFLSQLSKLGQPLAAWNALRSCLVWLWSRNWWNMEEKGVENLPKIDIDSAKICTQPSRTCGYGKNEKRGCFCTRGTSNGRFSGVTSGKAIGDRGQVQLQTWIFYDFLGFYGFICQKHPIISMNGISRLQQVEVFLRHVSLLAPPSVRFQGASGNWAEIWFLLGSLWKITPYLWKKKRMFFPSGSQACGQVIFNGIILVLDPKNPPRGIKALQNISDASPRILKKNLPKTTRSIIPRSLWTRSIRTSS